MAISLTPYIQNFFSKYFDEIYVIKRFSSVFKHHINLSNPRRFNEKIQFLKLYYRDDILVKVADKYSVREYVKEKGYGYTLNELIDVFRQPMK